MATKAIKMQGGRNYMPVAARVTHFRAAYPLGKISTKIIDYNIVDGYAVCESEVWADQVVMLANAQGSETRKDFQDFLEKAGTKSVGRALALAGYGTEECMDLEEGLGADGETRIADAPQARATTAPAAQARPAATTAMPRPAAAAAPPQPATAAQPEAPVPPGGFVPIPKPPTEPEPAEHDPFESDEQPINMADGEYFIKNSGLNEIMATKVFRLYMIYSQVEIAKINQMVDVRNNNRTDKTSYLRDALRLAYKTDLQAVLAQHNIHGDIASCNMTELCTMINELEA